jgi:hypothetical protein
MNRPLLLGVAALPLVLLVIAIILWAKEDRHPVAGMRRGLFRLSLVATAASLLSYAVFASRFAAQDLLWLRVGFWTGAAGLLLAAFGRGPSRGFALAAAVLIFAVWLMFAWTPA